MRPNPQFSADLVTFTEKILNGKLHLLSSDYSPPLTRFSLKKKFFIIRTSCKFQPKCFWKKRHTNQKCCRLYNPTSPYTHKLTATNESINEGLLWKIYTIRITQNMEGIVYGLYSRITSTEKFIFMKFKNCKQHLYDKRIASHVFVKCAILFEEASVLHSGTIQFKVERDIVVIFVHFFCMR